MIIIPLALLEHHFWYLSNSKSFLHNNSAMLHPTYTQNIRIWRNIQKQMCYTE